MDVYHDWLHVLPCGSWIRLRDTSARVYRLLQGVFHSYLALESPCVMSTARLTENNYHLKPAIITIREAAAILPPALILISSETEGESVSFVSEVFIYATDLPKDTARPLLQVMKVKPQHIIHFLFFNLVFSLGKFFFKSTPCCKTWSLFNYVRAVFETFLRLFFLEESTQEESRITVCLFVFLHIFVLYVLKRK